MTPRARTLAHAAIATGASLLLLIAGWLVVRRHAAWVLPFQLAGHEVKLRSPSGLLLVAALPYLFLVRSWSLTDHAPAQEWLSLAVRALVLVTLAAGLARPTILERERHVCTVLLVDVSASISDAALADAQSFAEAAYRARGDADLRLVRFAAAPEEVALPRKEGEPFPHIERFPGDAGLATDLAAALDLAQALFPPGSVRRTVILSDGVETDGDAIAAAATAAAQGTIIDVAPPRLPPPQDVSIRALHLPETIEPEAPFVASAELWSTEVADVDVTLFQDGFVNPLEAKKRVRVYPGRNDVPFRTVVHHGGAVTYKATIATSAPDALPANDRVVTTALVKGRPRVLYVEGEPDYGTDLSRALRAQQIDVDLRGPDGVPRSERELGSYDLVLLSDVPATHLAPAQMEAIGAYVRDLGGGFVMAGGQDSFGSGGYGGTPIERLLPVTFADEKKREEPKLALILVIDRSGSMGTGSGGATKIELAKEAAKSTAEVLNPDDLLGVVAFDTLPTVVVRIQRAANRMRIEEDISRLVAGGGTQILPALQEAFQELSTVQAKVKHVILLTDGQSSTEGLYELVDEMASQASGITLSTVGVGDDADREMLATVAQRGQGKFYFTRDPASIPRIFVDDTTQVARTSIVESPVAVREVEDAPFLRGLDFDQAPPLRGYVSTRAKPGAEVLLATPDGEPLLALWQRGLGRAIAWTSDVKARWAADWLAWDGFQRFWAQLVRANMRQGAGERFALHTAGLGGTRLEVEVDAVTPDGRFVDALDGTATLLDPDRPEWRLEAPLVQTGVGRYQATVALPRFGSYIVRATQRDPSGTLLATSEGAVSLPYPAELTTRPPDVALLERLAHVSQGSVSPAAQDIFSAGDRFVATDHDLWPQVVLIAMLFLVIDVAVRRIRLFGYRPLRL